MSTLKKKHSQKATMMSNQDANGDGNPCVDVGDKFYVQTAISYPQTATYSYTTPATLTTGQTLSYSFNPYPTYDVYWGGDERKSIPHLCRCNANMSQPHEDQIYIKKMWFCSVKCYEEWMVACIGTDIDEQ